MILLDQNNVNEGCRTTILVNSISPAFQFICYGEEQRIDWSVAELFAKQLNHIQLLLHLCRR